MSGCGCNETPVPFDAGSASGGCNVNAIQVAKGDKGEQGNPGPIGPTGLAPEHEWSTTYLRFRNPNGSWGTSTNLQGPQGVKGDQGDPGAPADTIAALLADPALLYSLRNALLPKSTIILCDVSPVSGDGYFDANGNGLLNGDGRDFRGWALCDGQVHGTITAPDLTDKFIIAAGNNYNVDDSGGADTITIGSANLPTHTHGVGTIDGSADSGGAHHHDFQAGGDGAGQTVPEVKSSNANFNVLETGNPTGTAEGAHTHTLTLTGSTADGGFANDPIDVIPPYYALVYIIKYE